MLAPNIQFREIKPVSQEANKGLEPRVKVEELILLVNLPKFIPFIGFKY